MSLLVVTKLNTVVNTASSRVSVVSKEGQPSQTTPTHVMAVRPVFGELPKSSGHGGLYIHFIHAVLFLYNNPTRFFKEQKMQKPGLDGCALVFSKTKTEREPSHGRCASPDTNPTVLPHDEEAFLTSKKTVPQHMWAHQNLG